MSKIKRVAVLGANGQVGSELCLLLEIMGQIKPIAVARSEYSTAILQMLGIECRHVTKNTPSELAAQIHDCDGVLELVHPWQENTAAMRREITQRAKTICLGVKDAAPVIYASTMSVYNLDPDAPTYTIYGRTKRFAERRFLQASQRTGHNIHILRLGQVHGAMQSCSIQLRRDLQKHRKIFVPTMESFSVFVSSIAEAICRIMDGSVRPATYTLISQPVWSYEELVTWWASQEGVEVETRPLSSAIQTRRFSLWNSIANSTRNFVYRHRDRLSDYAWAHCGNTMGKERFRHHCRLAARSIEGQSDVAFTAPFIQKTSVPGIYFPSLSDSRRTMPPLHALLEERLRQLQ